MYLSELDQSNQNLAVTEIKYLSDDISKIKNAKNINVKTKEFIGKVTKGIAITPSLKHFRLGMSQNILELKGTSKANKKDILEMIDQKYDFKGSFRVRVRKITEYPSIDTEKLERQIGDVIYKKGYRVDLDNPDKKFRVLLSEGNAYFGKVVSEKEDFEKRKPTKKPFFQPGSMDPKLARTLTNIAGGYKGNILLDPMCGTGGFLIEAKLVDSKVIGFDSQKKMVQGTYKNLSHYFNYNGWYIGLGDARFLPITNVECAVADFPYGRASKIDADSLESLYIDTLKELNRTVEKRIVVVSDRHLNQYIKKANLDLLDKIQDRVHRSLTRYIHILS